MRTYRFTPYTKDAPIEDQRSNVIFVMLRQAVMSTPMKADRPTDRAEWRRMGKLIDALAPLELHEELDGREIVRLVEYGGGLVLEDAESELLWRLVDVWLAVVPLGRARHVNWLLEFRDEHLTQEEGS